MLIRIPRIIRKLLNERLRLKKTFSTLPMTTSLVNLNGDPVSVKQRYEEVIRVLNSLQSNAAVISTIKPSKNCQSSNVEKTKKYLKRCGIDLNHLNGKVIHVSGTKGKGSTCALTESILRHHNYSTGFYSSPHLFSVTERIRINGRPISEELFTKYFWEVYNICYNNKDDPCDMPSYFKFLTVLAFKVFISENVDVAIVEVGIGGEYDCTNALRQTGVVGITSLGYDHLSVLGNTIEEIAWNKAGIMKPGCLAFSCDDQPASALKVLQDRAKEKNCVLHLIKRRIENESLNNVSKMAELNYSLATQLAHAWKHLKNDLPASSYNPIDWEPDLSADVEVLQNCIWPGRFHSIVKGNVTYYLDGAHTGESINICTHWFNHTARKRGKRILVFNIIGNRDAALILKQLFTCGFDLACFCPNVLDDSPLLDNLELDPRKKTNLQKKFAELWKEISGQDGKVFTSVKDTLSYIETLYNEEPIHVLVTGSLHLVGNTTCYLLPDIFHG